MDREKENSYNEWLVVNSQLGDRESFNKLLKHWYPRLTSYALRRLGDTEQAREAVQDCLVGVSRSLGRLRDPAAFPAWCFRLLERRCVDVQRRLIRERDKTAALTSDLANCSEVDEPESRVIAKISLGKVLKKLDSDTVLLLKLYYQESFTVTEIAQLLAIPAGTVKSRLFTARKTLAAALEK